MRTSNSLIWTGTAVMACLAGAFAQQKTALPAQNYKAWTDNGGGPDNSHYSALTQITKANVKNLQRAWLYPSHDALAYVWTPLVVDNTMYVLARNNSLVARDASTGKEIWVHEDLQGIAPRGINYWESKDRK